MKKVLMTAIFAFGLVAYSAQAQVDQQKPGSSRQEDSDQNKRENRSPDRNAEPTNDEPGIITDTTGQKIIIDSMGRERMDTSTTTPADKSMDDNNKTKSFEGSNNIHRKTLPRNK